MKLKLDNFEGSIELLFYLLTKNKIDIYLVSLENIIDQFILNSDDLEVDFYSDFMLVLSKLVSLKIKRLFEKQKEEEEELLVDECLEEFRKKEMEVLHSIAIYLESRYRMCKGRSFRPIPLIINDKKDENNMYSMSHLINAVNNIKKRKRDLIETLEPHPLFEHIINFKPLDVEAKITEIKDVLDKDGLVLFEITSNAIDEIVVTFLALLHIAKQGIDLYIEENSLVARKN